MLATRALLRRGYMSGKTMEVWLGHAVSLLQINRPSLSCLSLVYRFRTSVGEGRSRMWPSVLLEMRMAMALVLISEVNLGAACSTHVHCGDSSSPSSRARRQWSKSGRP